MNDSRITGAIDDVKRAAGSLRSEAANGLHDAETVLKRGVAESKARINDAIDVTAERVDQAHMYLKEQARDRPIAVTAAAVGAGIVIGLILGGSGGRRR